MAKTTVWGNCSIGASAAGCTPSFTHFLFIQLLPSKNKQTNKIISLSSFHLHSFLLKKCQSNPLFVVTTTSSVVTAICLIQVENTQCCNQSAKCHSLIWEHKQTLVIHDYCCLMQHWMPKWSVLYSHSTCPEGYSYYFNAQHALISWFSAYSIMLININAHKTW